MEYELNIKEAARGAAAALTQVAQSFDRTGRQITVSMAAARKAMEKEQLLLRLHFGKLKVAITDAVAPVAAVFLPALDRAVLGLTRFVRAVGQVLAALFAGSEGTAALTKDTDDAADAQTKLAKAATSAGKAVRRSLAGFDQIQRLDAPTGSGGSITTETERPGVQTLSPQLQAVVEQVNALLAPIRAIDLTPLTQSLGLLGQAFANLGGILTQALEWAWFNLLVPLSKWTVEEAAPATVGLLTQALNLLSAALEPVLSGIGLLMPYLEPVIGFIGETVILTLEALSRQFSTVAQVFREKGEGIRQVFVNIGQIVGAVWAAISPVLQTLQQVWGHVMEFMGTSAATTVAAVVEVLEGLTAFVSGVLTGDWRKAWEGVKGVFTGFANGIIGLLNGLIRGIVSGMNSVSRALNQLRFEIPNWSLFGSLAGKRFGLNLPTISAPQIPLLAKGAVLPANQPFLAVVGDQRHGTNVEAPLSTIQEAVAMTMEDMNAGNLAGHQATVTVLQQILTAVLGIEIGDRVIGQAAERYTAQQNMIKGVRYG